MYSQAMGQSDSPARMLFPELDNEIHGPILPKYSFSVNDGIRFLEDMAASAI